MRLRVLLHETGGPVSQVENTPPVMIPRTSQSFKLSRIGLAIIAASVLLLALLAVITVRNLDREQRLMEKFLIQEGLTLIRTFEAGARTSMMTAGMTGNLGILVKETAREESVVYIRIADSRNRLVAAAGDWQSFPGQPSPGLILSNTAPLARLAENGAGGRVFEVAREFKPLAQLGREKGRMLDRWQQWCMLKERGQGGERLVIYVGLSTAGFEVARQEDINHGLIMGGILFLVGVAGFYVLFLYQSNRVSRLTAENLEIYARNVIESMPAGLITIDRQGRIVSCNHKAREILGRESAELEGMVLARLGRETGCDLAGLLDGEKDFLDRSLECVLPGGRSIPLKVSAAALLNRDGERVGTVLTMRDMREIRDMEEQLERSRRLAALGRMAAAIAHEIRNPLGTLRGFAQYFRQQAENSATDRENADLMVSEVDRLNRTVSGLLQFARPREPEMRQVALGRLLEKAGRLMGDDFADHGIDFRLEPPEEEIIFKADPDLMIQVLINLLQNALHATGAGGRVELSGWAEPDTIVITVHDSGRGISQEVRSRMFDPFYTTQKEGSGLGLAVVHQVIEQHHGSIMVDSVVGRGTIIRLFLPGRAGNHPPGEDNG